MLRCNARINSFIVIVLSHFVAVDLVTSDLCDSPDIYPVNFHQHVEIQVGSNRTLSCVIYSDSPLKEQFTKWTREFNSSLPDHVITTESCPTLPNTTCSNLTLIHVSQSDGSGYYTITAENECGSDNFTVNVQVVNLLTCLNATELPPLLTPPPPTISAVEGQTVTVTATYKGGYDVDHLRAFWIIKVSNEKPEYIFPTDEKPGYNVTLTKCVIVNYNPDCCQFYISIVLKSVTNVQSGTKLSSAGAREDNLTEFIEGKSVMKVYKIPTIISAPDKQHLQLNTGQSTKFSCVYNVTSDPNITITKWSKDGAVITQNTSNYVLITEYGLDELDLVRSTLIISNVTTGNSGTYTCWCEYNKSLIYEKELIKSSSASVHLKVGPESRHKKSILILAIVLGAIAAFALVVLVITFSGCCYYNHKRKHTDTNLTNGQCSTGENSPLLSSVTNTKPLHNLAADTLFPVDNSINSKSREKVDTLEVDGCKTFPKSFSDDDGSTVEPGNPSDINNGASLEETLNPSHQKLPQEHQQHGQSDMGFSAEVDSNSNGTGQPLPRPGLKRLSTTNPIDSEKEAPRSEKPATTTHVNKGMTVLDEGSDAINTVLNQIAVVFTASINISAILPYLMYHQLVTYDQAYFCHNQLVPPMQKSQELLKYLRNKGDEVLQKLLCCLKKETTHLGHTDIAALLKKQMQSCKLDIEETCSLCRMDAITSKGTTSKILNHITPDFTILINLKILSPILLKHHLLTNDEAFICQSSFFPEGEKAQYLHLCLQRKGDKVLHKLLCCLKKETEHLGHNGLAAKLTAAMKLHNFEDELVCSVCRQPDEEPSTYHQPDVLEDVFNVISTNYPVERWEVLANKLTLSKHDIEQMKSLLDPTTQPVTMVLKQWRVLNLQATKENFIALLRGAGEEDSSVDSVLHLLQ